MKGLCCLVVGIPSPVRISIGPHDTYDLCAGVHVYVVGSMHSGTGSMMVRDRPRNRRLWHPIDYLLEHGEVLSTVAVPFGSEEQGCDMFRAIASCGLADKSVPGFGSSSCSCESHLVYFGEAEPERVIDIVIETVSSMAEVYPAMVTQSGSD